MGEVQDRVGENGKRGGERRGEELKGRDQTEENEVARGVIQRLRRGEAHNGDQREAAPMDIGDDELDVPNLGVPENQ